jgi:hypothetical protein
MKPDNKIAQLALEAQKQTFPSLRATTGIKPGAVAIEHIKLDNDASATGQP